MTKSPHLPENIHRAAITYSPTFAQEHRRTTKSRDPILFFHSWLDGEIEYQGYLFLLRKNGTGRAQLFEWFFGDESRETDVTPSFLSRCTFYDSNAAFKAAYEYHARTEQRD